jgi:hypothetical protein
MGNFHPLVPICLPQDVEILTKAEKLAHQMDDLVAHPVRPVLITETDLTYRDRFPVSNSTVLPDPHLLSSSLPFRLQYTRDHLVTTHSVADRITSDAFRNGYEVVAVLLVDGLSFEDVKGWPEDVKPCIVDGPSITFARSSDRTVVSDVGFLSITGTPHLARRLAELGIRHSRGYSYWSREQNDVSALLFQGIPLIRVIEMREAFDLLKSAKLSGIYLQLVREGLDGLAHSRREVTKAEVCATAAAIREDYLRLLDLMIKSKARGAAYLVADHGILWKSQHSFYQLEDVSSEHPRYSTSPPAQPDLATRFDTQAGTFYSFHYPYLGSRIRANDSGVHGGLSYWESIVPFVHVEVNL